MSAKKKHHRVPDVPPATAPDRSQWWWYAGLLAITLAAYYPAWHGGMLWDDDAHLTRLDLRSLAGLWRIWFDVGATQQYYPVAHSAFWLMHALWGDHTLGYHLVNIALHATSAWLLGAILRRLSVPGAMLAAIIFAVHPVHVESVAWMTELKNTLSGTFYLLAALAYLRFDDTRRPRSYAAALVLFVLALLTKTVTASLPAALLVVFWWQRGRLRGREDAAPLVPFFALGIVAGLSTSILERTQIGAEGADFHISFLERTVIAGRAIWFYLSKLVWPADLMFVYPRWTPAVTPGLLLYPIAAAALAAALWAARGRTRAPLAAFLFFAGTLFPALGFFNVYPFVYSFVADHFQYLASIGVIALASAGLATIAARGRLARGSVIAAALVIVLPLAGLTFAQSRQYVDAETLYRATLAKNPAAWMAHINLGWVYLGKNRVDEAMVETREALRLKPDLSQAHNNLGTMLLDQGRAEEAVASFREALRLKPSDEKYRRNLALGLQHLADDRVDRGDIEGAVSAYQESLQWNPDSPETHHNLGSAFARQSRWDEAIAQYQEAVRLNPQSDRAVRNLARARNARGLTLAAAGRFAEAAADFAEAVRLDPQLLEAQANLSRARAAIK
jgi:tetratricopeptide (TPR) repeat protein